MPNNRANDPQGDNTQKNPDDWTTGGEPATEKIEELQAKTGRSGEPTDY